MIRGMRVGISFWYFSQIRDKILPAWNTGLATLQHQTNGCVAKLINHTQQKLIIWNKYSCDQNGINNELIVEERQPKKRMRNDESENKLSWKRSTVSNKRDDSNQTNAWGMTKLIIYIISIIYFTEFQLYCLSTLSTVETFSIRQQSTYRGRLDGMLSMSISVRFYFYCPGGLRPFHSSGNLSSIFALLYVALFVM